jgi:hypothetical protein
VGSHGAVGRHILAASVRYSGRDRELEGLRAEEEEKKVSGQCKRIVISRLTCMDVLAAGLWFLRPAGPSVKIWLEDKSI